jgi:hypothetical protein
LKKAPLNREGTKNAKENKGKSFVLFAPSREIVVFAGKSQISLCVICG